MPADFKDYYTILGVPRDASASDIKKAFRKLARKHHPDVAEDKATSEEKFKEINEANEVLGDPEKRRKYDQLGANWRDQGAPPPPRHGGRETGAPPPEFNFGGTGFSDFFEQYFSNASRYGFPENMPGGQQRGGSRKFRGSDIEGAILVSLDEALNGSLRPLSLQMTDPQTGRTETRSFQVRIPPGVTDGRLIRVPGQGEPGIGGGDPGDLYLRVRHAAHPDFHTEGVDVFYELELAPWDVVLGADIDVPTLNGTLKLRIPPNSENGQQLRVRGRGLPKGNTGERGDFHAVLNLKLPTENTDEERALWEKLRSASHFNPQTPTQP
jgi:curved DNA-binding protein